MNLAIIMRTAKKMLGQYENPKKNQIATYKRARISTGDQKPDYKPGLMLKYQM